MFPHQDTFGQPWCTISCKSWLQETALLWDTTSNHPGPSFPERPPPQVASGCRGVGFCKSIRQGSASPPNKQAKAVWTTWEHHSVDPCFLNSATATSHCRWSKVRRFRCPVGSPSGYSDGTTPIPTIHKWPALRRPSWNQCPLICGRLLSVSSHQDTRRPAPVPERSRCDVQMGPALGDEV